MKSNNANLSRHRFLLNPYQAFSGTWFSEETKDFAAIREFIDACLRPSKAPEKLKPYLSSNDILIDALLEKLRSLLPPLPNPETDPVLKQKLVQIDSKLEAKRSELEEARHTLHVNRKQKKIRTARELASAITGEIKRLEAQRNALLNPRSSEETRIRRHAVERLGKEFEMFKRGDLELSFVSSVRRVYWKILSPSGDSWKEICDYFDRLSKSTGHRYELSRLQKIYTSYNPSDVYVGLSCFEGYVVFCFPKSGVAVLECPRVGNALYLMPHTEWKFLSQASKTELLSKHSEQVTRILHTDSWFNQLHRHLSCKESRW